MFNNESVLKFIASRVFPSMEEFSPDGNSRLGLWDITLKVGDDGAWLTVSYKKDSLFQIEVCGVYVKARYALPVVVELSSGELEYGTSWAVEREWRVGRGVDASDVATNIGFLFNNIEEFLEAEAEVYKTINSPGKVV